MTIREQLEKKYGKPKASVRSRLEAKYGKITETKTVAEPEKKNFFQDAIQDIKETGSDIKSGISDYLQKTRAIKEREDTGKQGLGSTMFQQIAQTAGTASNVLGSALIGAGKVVLPEKVEKGISNVASSVVSKVTDNEKVKEAIDWWKDFEEKNPGRAANIKAAGQYVELISDVAGVVGADDIIKKGLTKKIKTILPKRNVVSKLPTTAIKTPSTSTVKQLGQEIIERVPRIIQRGKEALAKVEDRAKRINTSRPEVGDAIKARLDDALIEAVESSDDVTRKAMKEAVDISDNIKNKERASIVSGKLAGEQADIIVKEKKRIGKMIGDEVEKLSKTKRVDISDTLKTLDEALIAQDIDIVDGKLGFSRTNYQPVERAKIQELYDLTREAGNVLTPKQIHAKDSLFSKLNRQANMEKIGNIVVNTPEGPKNLYSFFRDTFSNKLEDIAPAIKPLNKQYRDLSIVVKDIEDSILKAPNLNITKTVDSANFAKNNLRRIFSNAQSASSYEAIADLMDSMARKLGYKGASPKTVYDFTLMLEDLFPKKIPKASFTGGIRTGVKGTAMNALEGVIRAGSPNLRDKINALKKLLKTK